MTRAPCKATPLTSLGRVCLPKPAQCWVKEPSKCHSSSAAIPPCLGQARSSPVLPQPSETHRDAAHQDTTHKETQARALLCWAGLPLVPSTSPTSSPRPEMGSPGLRRSLVRLQHYVALGTRQPSHSLAARTGPSSCRDDLPLSPQPCWRRRAEQSNLLPQPKPGESTGGPSEATSTYSRCRGEDATMVYTQHSGFNYFVSTSLGFDCPWHLPP